MIDVSIAKYSEAIATSGDEMRYVLSWLHGNYDDKAGDTTINLPALGDTGTAIGKKCGQNPNLGLMTATKQLIK